MLNLILSIYLQVNKIIKATNLDIELSVKTMHILVSNMITQFVYIEDEPNAITVIFNIQSQ